MNYAIETGNTLIPYGSIFPSFSVLLFLATYIFKNVSFFRGLSDSEKEARVRESKRNYARRNRQKVKNSTLK